MPGAWNHECNWTITSCSFVCEKPRFHIWNAMWVSSPRPLDRHRKNDLIWNVVDVIFECQMTASACCVHLKPLTSLTTNHWHHHIVVCVYFVPTDHQKRQKEIKRDKRIQKNLNLSAIATYVVIAWLSTACKNRARRIPASPPLYFLTDFPPLFQ